MRAVALAFSVVLPLAFLSSCTVSEAQTGLGPASKHAAAQTLPVSPLVIESGGRRLTFHVELASTPEHRRTGLMFQLSMPADHGMLFDFEKPNPVAMWMKNTYIPLDIIFIDSAGLVVHIAKNTEPHSLDTISSGRPVRAVLEINGGLSDRLGFKVGDRIVHQVFAPPPNTPEEPSHP